MLVLGISGLDRSAEVKREIISEGRIRELRMVQGLDSAAALVDDTGVLAACAEERCSGVKGTGRFPAGAIQSCLDAVGAKSEDIDIVAHGFSYAPGDYWESDELSQRWYSEVYAKEVQREVLAEKAPRLAAAAELVHVEHHVAHAASAFYLSGFDSAAVLVSDGLGEHDSTTLFVGDHNGLRPVRSYSAMSSLGIVYGVVTHYLGFQMNMDEYKVMGLAPYGDPARFRSSFARFVERHPDGGLFCPLLLRNRDAAERETHAGALRWLEEELGPAPEPGTPVADRFRDIAAALQETLEKALLHVLRWFAGQADVRRLCVAGGVGLNCVANGAILRSGLVDQIFVQPAAGDDGSALGAAIHASDYRRSPRRMTMPFWGDDVDDERVRSALRDLPSSYEIRELPEERLVQEVVVRVRSGQVVSVCRGRMEFGPRALGNRSIIADATAPRMRDHLNAVVKERETFRPFAPVVPCEDLAQFFEVTGDCAAYHHMLLVTDVRPEFRDRLPGVTHVDGSARVQAVDRDQTPFLWALCKEHQRHTGVPVLINTSFNLRSQPIVRTPADAVQTWARSAIDVLVLGGALVTRPADR